MRRRASSSYTARRERRRFRATLLRQIATAKRRALHYQATLDAEIRAVNAALARGVSIVVPSACGGNASSLRSVDAARYQYAVATTPGGAESRLPLSHDQVWSAVLHQAGVSCGHTSGSLSGRLVDRHPVPLTRDGAQPGLSFQVPKLHELGGSPIESQETSREKGNVVWFTH